MLTVFNGRLTGEGVRIADIDGSLGYLTVDGAAMVANGIMEIGYQGSATLLLDNTASLTGVTTRLAAQSGSDALFDLLGASSWTCTDLDVGAGGTASLFILGGSTASCDNANIGRFTTPSADVTVSDLGSVWTIGNQLSVGASSVGTLTVAGEGTVTATTGIIGETIDGDGTLTVEDADSLLDITTDLIVADAGAGAMTIQNDGDASIQGHMTIGETLGPIGTVDVLDAGSRLSIGGDLTIGNFGQGTLTANFGSNVDVTGVVVLGNQAGSMGTLNVYGPGTTFDAASNLTVGNSNAGILSVSGGIATVQGWGIIARLPGSSGAINVRSTGQLICNGGISIAPGGLLGSLHCSTGGLVQAPSITVEPNGVLSGSSSYDVSIELTNPRNRAAPATRSPPTCFPSQVTSSKAAAVNSKSSLAAWRGAPTTTF